MKTEDEARRAVGLYADTVRRICFLYLKNRADTEDIAQDVFLSYLLYSGAFESEEHERAWFIRVTINRCKDLLRKFLRRRQETLEQAEHFSDPAVFTPERLEVLEALRALPENQRAVLYLSVYEGYTAAEIGRILKKNENTVYTWIARAKARLRETLGGDGK